MYYESITTELTKREQSLSLLMRTKNCEDISATFTTYTKTFKNLHQYNYTAQTFLPSSSTSALNFARKCVLLNFPGQHCHLSFDFQETDFRNKPPLHWLHGLSICKVHSVMQLN